MPVLNDASPQLSLRLYKTIARSTVDGKSAVSSRYKGKDPYIDLTPFLNSGSVVRTSKSVREPAGAWSVTFADRPHRANGYDETIFSSQALESIYGLVEPMDMIEIRMWRGYGMRPAGAELPIIMRGFVSEVQRSQTMGENGVPQRQVVISGQDYGKAWQVFQVLYLAAYAEGKGLLTSFSLNELFGVQVVNAMPAAEFVRTMIQKIINPYLKGFIPENSPLPKELTTGDGLAVKHGMVNQSFQNQQGSIYDILKFHGDVGVWNELYTEDREDGVHVVYRPIPALHLTKPDGAANRKIQDDAPDPVIVEVLDDEIQSHTVLRSDADVANFYWVSNSRFDLIDDMQRKLASIPVDSGKVVPLQHPNSDRKYYALRPMYAETQQGGDAVTNQTSGQDEGSQESRSKNQEAWLDRRRRLMMEMNKDNVVFEKGSVRIKGGPMRKPTSDDKLEAMKAGDYALIRMGNIASLAYVYQVSHEFVVGESFVTTLSFERGEGFAVRMGLEGGISSPWLAEQSTLRTSPRIRT